MLSEHRRWPLWTAGRAAHPMFETLIGRRAHLLMLEPLPEAERLEVFVAMNIHAVLHRIRRHPSGLQRGSQLLGIAPADQFSNELVERCELAKASTHRCEAR